jgi:hypothetical protein
MMEYGETAQKAMNELHAILLCGCVNFGQTRREFDLPGPANESFAKGRVIAGEFSNRVSEANELLEV